MKLFININAELKIALLYVSARESNYLTTKTLPISTALTPKYHYQNFQPEPSNTINNSISAYFSMNSIN